MNDKQKSLLRNSLRVFNNIRNSMNNTDRKGTIPFELRGRNDMKYKLSPNSNNVTISKFNNELYNEMEELLKLDDNEWQEALGENEDVSAAKAKVITLVNVIRQQRGLGEPYEGGEDFYKEPEEQEQEDPEPENSDPENSDSEQDQNPEPNPEPEQEPQERTIYRFGVRKDFLKGEIDRYQRTIDQKGPVTRPNSPKIAPRKRDVETDILNLYKKLESQNAALEKLLNDKTSKTRSQDIAKLRKSIEETQKRIGKVFNQYSDVLDYGYIVDELKNLIEKSKFNTFVEMDSIDSQIKFYEGLLSGTDINKEELTQRREELIKGIEADKKREDELQNAFADAFTSDSKDVTLADRAGMLKTLKEFRDKESKFLKTNKANHYRDMISALDRKIAELEKEPGIQEELAKLDGKQDREITTAEKDITLKLLEEIRKSFRNSKGKVNGKVALSTADLDTELKRIRAIKAKSPADTTKIQEELERVQKSISDKEKEVQEIDQKLKFKSEVPEHEQELQKRSAEVRLKELRELSKDKELFKITEKGEVVINYPERSISEEDQKRINREITLQISSQIESANDLMVKEYYGHRETKTEFDEIMDRLYDPENRVMKKGIKYEEGKPVEYEYEGIKDYEGRDEDLAKIKMSDFVMIFERVQRANQGDLSDYEKMKNGLEQYNKDVEYLETNNGKYDRVAATTKNLKTLGKYGEKVEYTKFQEGQPVRNALRGVGNALKFVRNHTTAPVYHFIGDKIASPIYARLHKGQEDKSRGSFENKPLHRYLARREYFESQGKGFFSSRFNAIFNATKGNQALLNAGSNEIRKFYVHAGAELMKQKRQQLETRYRLEAIEFRKKDISEQIQMLEEAVKTTTDPKDKAKYEQTLADYKKAAAQIERDTEIERAKEAAANKHVSMDVRYDTVDMDQHDKANKDTITKSVAIIKGFAKLGIRHFVAPKIKEWLLSKSQQEVKVPSTTYEDQVTGQTYVDTTYKTEEVPIYDTQYDSNISMKDIMSQNAGKNVQGFYSVYGGEKGAQMYTLTGNEKVTAVFQSVGNKGVGYADTAGLTAPTLVDNTFDSSLLDANGVLGQDVTLDKLIDMIGSGNVDESTLDGMYFSLGDKAWFKVSDLYKMATKQVQVGTETQQVVDVAGHWEDVIEKVPVTTYTTSIVENPKITKVLKGLGIFGKAAYGTSVVEDIYENTRKTETDVEHTKPDPRDMTPVEIKIDGEKQPRFTGKRSEDLPREDKEDEER